MENKVYEIVDGVEKLEAAIARVRKAQRVFATYTQEQVDKIFLAAAIAAGADTYVSGTLSYHDMADAPDGDVNLIEAGHFHTEDLVCDVLSELVWSADPTIDTEYFCSYRAKHI